MWLRMKTARDDSRLERGKKAKRATPARIPPNAPLDLPPLGEAEPDADFSSQRAYVDGRIIRFDGKRWRG